MNPYLKSQIFSTSPLHLIIFLYDRLINHLDLAINGFEENAIEQRLITINDNLIFAQKIIMELNVMLDMEKGGEPAIHLRNFYESLYAILVEVNMTKKDTSKIKKIKSMISDLRDAWKQISKPSSISHENQPLPIPHLVAA